MVLAIASTDDVRRYLDGVEKEDDEIFPALDVAEEWVLQATGRMLPPVKGATVTEQFFNVRQTDTIYLSDAEPGSLQIKVFPSPGTPDDSAFLFTDESNRFNNLGSGRIQLIYSEFVIPAGYNEATQRLTAGYYNRVDAIYVASGKTPARLREAVAIIAASNLTNAVASVSGISSETIGKYTYTRSKNTNGKSDDPIPPLARTYLSSYTARIHPRSV